MHGLLLVVDDATMMVGLLGRTKGCVMLPLLLLCGYDGSYSFCDAPTHSVLEGVWQATTWWGGWDWCPFKSRGCHDDGTSFVGSVEQRHCLFFRCCKTPLSLGRDALVEIFVLAGVVGCLQSLLHIKAKWCYLPFDGHQTQRDFAQKTQKTCEEKHEKNHLSDAVTTLPFARPPHHQKATYHPNSPLNWPSDLMGAHRGHGYVAVLQRWWVIGRVGRFYSRGFAHKKNSVCFCAFFHLVALTTAY